MLLVRLELETLVTDVLSICLDKTLESKFNKPPSHPVMPKNLRKAEIKTVCCDWAQCATSSIRELMLTIEYPDQWYQQLLIRTD